MFSYKDLKNTLANVRLADETFFREAGLQPLSRRFESYPATHEGQKIYVLLPRGLDPKNAQRMEESDAESKLMVLTGNRNHWAKAWPAVEPPVAAPAKQKEDLPDSITQPESIITDD